MDLRVADEVTQIREMIERALRGIHTSMPGNITAFDSGPPQRVMVQPGIAMQTNVNGKTGTINLPPIINVPLVIPFGSTAGFGITVPIKAGDPVLLIFSQRAIDNWVDFGGVQAPVGGVSSRHHNLTDAFALLMPSPTAAGAFGEWDADGISVRNRDKTSLLKIRNDDVAATAGASILTLKNDGTVTLAAPGGAKVTGNLEVDGNITYTGSVTHI